MTYWIWVTATLIGYTMSSGLWATTDPWAVCRGPCIILIACCLHLNSTRECWVGSRHPLPCMPTTMVSRFCTARQAVLWGGQTKLFQELMRPLFHNAKGPFFSCLIKLVESCFSGSVLNCAGWGTDIPWGIGTILFALPAGSLTILSAGSRGAVNVERDHILGM